ncbi:MAG: murein biosynthesis integral membrane protein MurJ [Acidobacteriota bacterium]
MNRSVMTHSLGKKIGIASLIMMTSVFLSRIIGLFRDMVIADFAGIAASVDAYDIAFMIPDYLNHLAAGGFLSITFIPIFSDYMSRNRENDGWRIFSIILNSIGCLLLALVIAGMVFTPDLIDLVAHEKGPVVQGMAVQMTRIILPAQLFFFAGGLFMAAQYAKERFLIPALSPLIYNLGIIAGGLILGPSLGMEGFCWGVLGGAFLGNFLIQLWGAGRIGMKYNLRFGIRHPDFIKYIRLTLPLMVGFGMMFSMEFLVKFFAARLPEGSNAALKYSKTIMLIPVGLFGQAVAVASYPFMARLAAEKQITEMNELINTALRYLSFVIPFSVMMILERHELVQIIYERGQFGPDDTVFTAGILVFLLPGAFALSAYTVLARGYYAMQNTLYPAVFGIIAVTASLPVYWYGKQWMGAQGVALAVSISVISQVVLFYVLWNRRTDNRESRRVFSLYAKIVGISVVLGILAEWFRRWAFAGPAHHGSMEALGVCCVIGGGYSLLFLGCAYVLKIEEIKTYVYKLTRVTKKVIGPPAEPEA